MTLLWIAAAMAAGVVLFRIFRGNGRFRSVSPTEALEMMKSGKVFLLDVRTAGEYSRGKIKGAQFMPLSEIGNRADQVPLDKPVIIYCASGIRSKMAASALSRKGYAELYDLAGGIHAWQRAGLPVDRG